MKIWCLFGFTHFSKNNKRRCNDNSDSGHLGYLVLIPSCPHTHIQTHRVIILHSTAAVSVAVSVAASNSIQDQNNPRTRKKIAGSIFTLVKNSKDKEPPIIYKGIHNSGVN